jgi:hypothetical protein
MSLVPAVQLRVVGRLCCVARHREDEGEEEATRGVGRQAVSSMRVIQYNLF